MPPSAVSVYYLAADVSAGLRTTCTKGYCYPIHAAAVTKRPRSINQGRVGRHEWARRLRFANQRHCQAVINSGELAYWICGDGKRCENTRETRQGRRI